MSSSTQSRTLLPRLRSRAGVTLTAGVCAAALMAGTGVAAADSRSDVFAAGGALSLAEYARGQADVQQQAVESEIKKLAEAKQAAEAQQAAEKKAAEKKAAEKKAAEKKAAEAKKAKASGWVTPIAGGYTLTATYGNDGGRWASGHSGQDFAVPTGTDVRSVAKGTVVKAGGNGGGDGPAYGNAVVVKHSNGTYSQYAHLATVHVNIGQTVEAGQKIALSGNTGNSTGPHLHFEIRTTADYGSSVNPRTFLGDKGVTF